jgi:predicted ATPase
LACCADLLAAGCEIKPFKLGEKDVVQKFLVPQNLYGRERELQELLGLFEMASAGRTEFCLVYGYPGVGKSALVNEIDRPLVRERGFLVQGKFEQFQHGEAYTALAAVFRCLVQQVLAESQERLKEWRRRLLDILTPNARLVMDLVPELELIIGHQPAVAELPPAEACPLSEMIYDKAQGNPFFSKELLRQLHKEGALVLDSDSGRWNWDLDAAR